MSVFSQRLASLRERVGYSKTKMANKVGVALSTYANWEYGYNEPDMNMLCKIATSLNTSIDYLTGKVDDPDPHTGKDNDTLTWEDLGMPYKGKIPDELKATYADIAKGYFERHPEYLNKD